MSIEKIIEKLDGVKNIGSNRYKAKCPAHDDKDPSLVLTETSDGRILLHCFAGCPPINVLHAIGLEMTDLFPNGCLGELKGWEQLTREREARQQTKKQESLDEDRIFIAVCDGARKNGQRLTQKEMQQERQAYLRIRNANAN